MRPIKFRTILRNEKIFRKVSAIDFLNLEVLIDISSCHEWHEYKVLEQFTGLQDKNGKDIYEGDIVKDIRLNDLIGKVVFGGYFNYAGFGVETNQPVPPSRFPKTWDILTIEYCLCLEIIGNIHETPELLNDN